MLARGPEQVRVESGPAVDTNVTREEGAARISDGLARVVLDLRERARVGQGARLSAGYHGGAKRFFEQSGEDVLAQQLEAGVAARAGKGLVLRADASLKDRTTRASANPRDYSRWGLTPGLDLQVAELAGGRLVVALRGQAERFVYKPDARLNADGAGGRVSLAWRRKGWTGSLSGSLLRRSYEGAATRAAGTGAEGAVLSGSEPGLTRRDTYRRIGASLRYSGSWLGTVAYGFAANDSNSLSSSYERHDLDLQATLRLPWRFIVSGRLRQQLVRYADPQFISADTFVEEEGRSQLTVRLERPLAGDWSVVASGGGFFTAFGAGPEYEREIGAIGVAYTRDR